MRITSETLFLVGIVLALFVLALICLACSLNGRELLDCSIFRCCCKRRNRNSHEDDDPPVYATLSEFVFEASSDDNERGAIVYLGSNELPTTMQQIFPDLLGGGAKAGGTGMGIGASTNNNHDGNAASSTNGDLREPLL